LAHRLALCLKPSQNLHAQLLLAEVGRQAERQSTQGAPPSAARRHDEWGLATLPGFLTRVGISDGSVVLEEGSGLSRTNRVTPAATVALLRFMATHPQHKVWKDSLPVGGMDGTLKNRFKTGHALRNVRAKTGSLRGVHALGGYLTTAGGEELVFALYANQAQSDPQARARMDRFVEILASSDLRMNRLPAVTTPPR
jgi:D-alanyl-D-alanine carboxypeptidase/D-alanyl-D-alanine-endopeptidase (penicillin-binding protein 4)